MTDTSKLLTFTRSRPPIEYAFTVADTEGEDDPKPATVSDLRSYLEQHPEVARDLLSKPWATLQELAAERDAAVERAEEAERQARRWFHILNEAEDAIGDVMPHIGFGPSLALFKDAAAELTRLRAEVKGLQKARDQLAETSADEINRLRARVAELERERDEQKRLADGYHNLYDTTESELGSTIGALEAEVERLTARGDTLAASLDRMVARCERMRPQWEEASAARDAAQAEVERMRPVVINACAWRDGVSLAANDLFDSVDTYRAAAPELHTSRNTDSEDNTTPATDAEPEPVTDEDVDAWAAKLATDFVEAGEHDERPELASITPEKCNVCFDSHMESRSVPACESCTGYRAKPAPVPELDLGPRCHKCRHWEPEVNDCGRCLHPDAGESPGGTTHMADGCHAFEPKQAPEPKPNPHRGPALDVVHVGADRQAHTRRGF